MLLAITAFTLNSASQAGPLSINLGVINVNPSSATSEIEQNTALGLKVDDNTQLGITIDYMVNDQWGLELMAATPFEHDIDGAKTIPGAAVGSTKHLPPTLYAQYYIEQSDSLQFFIGAGINYTIFFEEQAGEDLKALLSSTDVELELDNSLGLAAQLGLNYKYNDRWGAHFMAAWIDIDTEATVRSAGTELNADVEIDPLVLFAAVKYYF